MLRYKISRVVYTWEPRWLWLRAEGDVEERRMDFMVVYEFAKDLPGVESMIELIGWCFKTLGDLHAEE